MLIATASISHTWMLISIWLWFNVILWLAVPCKFRSAQGSDHSHMDRSILVVFLATIVVIYRVSRYPLPRCLSISVFPWHSFALPHQKAPPSNHTQIHSLVRELANLSAPLSCMLLAYCCCWPTWLEWQGVEWRHLHGGHAKSLKVQYSDCHWGGLRS